MRHPQNWLTVTPSPTSQMLFRFYRNIYNLPDTSKNHVLPEDKPHKLWIQTYVAEPHQSSYTIYTSKVCGVEGENHRALITTECNPKSSVHIHTHTINPLNRTASCLVSKRRQKYACIVTSDHSSNLLQV